jgi:hypothetical protein
MFKVRSFTGGRYGAAVADKNGTSEAKAGTGFNTI